MKHEVGSKVKCIFEDGVFKVIATNEKPYKHKGGEVITVGERSDYVIVKVSTGQVERFKQVKAGDIEPLK